MAVGYKHERTTICVEIVDVVRLCTGVILVGIYLIHVTKRADFFITISLPYLLTTLIFFPLMMRCRIGTRIVVYLNDPIIGEFLRNSILYCVSLEPFRYNLLF